MSTTAGNTSQAERIAQNPTFERFARAGYVMTGIVHLIIGYLALRLAFGGGSKTADQSGAMAEVASKPGGVFVLWFAVVAFVLLALWRLAETFFGSASKPDHADKKHEAFRRGKAFALTVVYLAFAFTALSFARGAGKSGTHESRSWSARLMENTGGKILLVLIALAIIGVGGYHMYKGASKKFLKDLQGGVSQLVRRMGMTAYIVKGLAIAAIGVLLIIATFHSKPDEVSGLDGALKTLGAQPYGVILLVVAALGIIVYGLYSFVMARFAKM
ncbi:DUF1206 domain-containing protein [Nocardia sp. XZ_19_385]|uniref:DUF1206 domain-containing protein n=1 Tax=Nocardia sp. XZ_19_385 TaxID=2769488 RepID=UPI001890109A|nr:DUF1206 domain-containing protein [Nocardia sp. XZ_19_385]